MNLLLWLTAEFRYLCSNLHPSTPQGKEQPSLWALSSKTSCFTALHILQVTGPLCWLAKCLFSWVMSLKSLQQNRHKEHKLFSANSPKPPFSVSDTILTFKIPPPSVTQSGQRPPSDSRNESPITDSCRWAFEVFFPYFILDSWSPVFSKSSDLRRNRSPLALTDSVFAFEYSVHSLRPVVDSSQT